MIGLLVGLPVSALLRKSQNPKTNSVIALLGVLAAAGITMAANTYLMPFPILNFMLTGMVYSAVFANRIPEEQLDGMMSRCTPIIGGCFTLIILNLGAPLDYHLILNAGLFTAIYIVTRAVGKIGVIANTLMTLHAFPDRRLMAEDVVWSEDSPGVFLSSHRILSTGTNLGDSNFGPATGKKVYFRTIADCACTKNKIFEEWLVRDNLWIVQQLGLNPWELAAKMAAGQPAKQVYGRDECMEGQLIPEAYRAEDSSVGEQVLELLNEVYNRKLINRICDFYADNAVVHSICNQDQIGHDEIQGAVISLLSSFPNARMIVDRVTCNDSADGSWHVSARWRLRGLHEGIGMYGAPTGKPVEILGITQYRFENGKIVEAWEIYDGLDVIRQLCLGDQPATEG